MSESETGLRLNWQNELSISSSEAAVTIVSYIALTRQQMQQALLTFLWPNT